MSKPVPTLKGFVFGLITALVLLAGFLGSGYPYIQFLAVILGGILSGAYGYTLWLSKILYDIEARRFFSSERAVEGANVEVFVRVRNNSQIPVYRLEIEDYPPWRAKPLTPPSFISSLDVGEEKEFSYVVKPSFGRHRWNRLTLSVGDPLGLFKVNRSVYVVSGLSASPVWSEIEGWFRKEDLSGASGAISRRRRGFSLEFYEIREYQPGDDIRRVVWSATARTGSLMVREDLDEIRASPFIFLDLSSDSWAGSPGRSPADLIAKLALSIVNLSARSGGVAGYTIFYGNNWRSFGPARAGDVLESLSAALSVSSPKDSRGRILLSRALEDALQRAEGRKLILLFGPGVLQGDLWNDLKKLLLRTSNIVIAIASPWSDDEVSNLIRKLELKVLENRYKDFAKLGWRIIIVKDPFTAWEVIKNVFR